MPPKDKRGNKDKIESDSESSSQNTQPEMPQDGSAALTNFVLNTKQFDPTKDDWKIFSEKLTHLLRIANVKMEDQVSVLISVLSTRAYKLLRSLCTPSKPEAKTFKELIEILDKHFVPSKNCWKQRKIFFDAVKDADESISSWHARVMDLASECEFGTEITKFMTFKFVTGISGKIFEQLAEQAANSCLESLVTIALTKETKLNHSESDQMVNMVVGNANDGSTGQRVCTRCGKGYHNYKVCKYKTYKCNMCGMFGHLAAVCRSKEKLSQHSYTRSNNKGAKGQSAMNSICENTKKDKKPSDKQMKRVSSVKFDSHNLIKNIVVENCKEPLFISVEVDDKTCMFELDSGAGISAITERSYIENFKKRDMIKNKSVKITGYTGNTLYCAGFFDAVIRYKNEEHKVRLYVIKKGINNILGRDFLQKFNMGFTVIKNLNNSENCNQKLSKLLEKYAVLFDGQLGNFTFGKVNLEIKENALPKFFKPRPVPFARKKLVEEELCRWCQEGLITKVENAEWGTPIVVVPKANGIRICGDYKITLNPYLKEFNHPLPRIEDIFASLSGGKYFAKLDIKEAFLQLSLDEKSQNLCALSTHIGIFKMNKMPYGIKVATSKFQQAIEKVIAGLDGVAVYVDDMLIAGCSKEQLLQRLESVFRALKNAGLKLNKEKCIFFSESIDYLGHTIDSNGLSKNKDRVQSLLNIKEPSNIDELRAFCGIVNYYAKFVPNIARTMNPLYALLKPSKSFNFDKECKQAFTEIKDKISEDITLAHYSLDDPLILTTDASKHSVGAVLATVQGNIERPIVFISRKLTKAEENYSVVDKEALAVIYAFKKLRQYLIGRHFELRVDQKSLVRIFHPEKETPVLASERLKRWSCFISGYDFELKYIPTKKNIADPLTRSNNVEDRDCKTENKEQSHEIKYIAENGQKLVDLESLQLETAVDPVLKHVLEAISKQTLHKLKGREFSSYVRRKDEIGIESNILIWRDRVIVPNIFRKYILKELHSSHMGIERTKSVARNYFWWPSMNEEIEQIVKNCEACIVNSFNPPKTSLIPWQIPARAWSRIHIDFAGPKWNHWYLIIVDAKTKWLEVFKTRQATAAFTKTKLRETLARYGLCDMIVTDNAAIFNSDTMQDFFKSNGIIHRTSAPYFPQTNGQAENSVKTTKNALIKSLHTRPKTDHEIEVSLQNFLLSYRITPHTSTGTSPAEMLLGRKLKTRLDVVIPETIRNKNEENQWNEKAIKSQRNQIKYYGGKKKKKFKINQRIKMKMFKNNKFYWTKGKIMKILGHRFYICQSDAGEICKKHVDCIASIK